MTVGILWDCLAYWKIAEAAEFQNTSRQIHQTYLFSLTIGKLNIIYKCRSMGNGMVIMMTKEELKQKENFKVNNKEYFRILSEEHLSVLDYEEWSIFYKSVMIHKKLNNIFESDPFIYKLILGHGYPGLLKDKNDNGCIGALTSDSFDHTSTMRLRSGVSEVPYSDTVTGVITFPYFHGWEDVKYWIDRVPESFSVYIINPILLFYGLGTAGLFLTPKYYTGYNIELCNRFIITLTGYPLFLTFTMDEDVEKITHVDLGLCKENFVEEIYSISNHNEGLLKVLEFWKNNEEISIPMIDGNYKEYLDFQPYLAHCDVSFMKIASTKPFKLVHEDTGDILGTFREFMLFEPLSMIKTENGEFKLSDKELKDIIGGKYEFRY